MSTMKKKIILVSIPVSFETLGIHYLDKIHDRICIP